jgi:hypothetical protein
MAIGEDKYGYIKEFFSNSIKFKDSGWIDSNSSMFPRLYEN